jgi:4-hydroxybenzoate polyprenyltransferase
MTGMSRAAEWWEYKLIPIFATFYATALMLRVPVSALWPAALTLLVALVPGAVYVSVINDLTDREEDLAAGKINRVAGRNRAAIAAVLALSAGAGIALSWWWRHDVLLLSLYLGAWLAFSLYSLPPFRFKTRGFPGVLADASGAHLFPTLVGVTLAFRAAGRLVDTAWLLGAGLWALAYGVRGILWHQLSDVEQDRQAGVRTFAQRHSPELAARIGTYAAFPLELLALALLLWRIHDALPLLALALYALLATRRRARWHIDPVIVQPTARFQIVLQEYYDVFYPLSLLLASALQHRADVLALAAHLLLFPMRALQTAKDCVKLTRQHLRRSR